MKGILQLIELNKENPDNPIILTNLGRLAIQTGQYEKAIQCLESALIIEPTNRNANCLLAKAYEAVGNKEKSDFYLNQCR